MIQFVDLLPGTENRFQKNPNQNPKMSLWQNNKGMSFQCVMNALGDGAQ